MKANYGIPEIWFAEDDEAKLLRTAAALDRAGLRTVLVAGSDLVEIPGQSPAESFAFTDEGLQGERDDSGWTMAYDAPTTAVFSRPRVDVQDAKAPDRSTPSLRRDPLLSLGRGGSPSTEPGCGPGQVRSLAVSRPLCALRQRAAPNLDRPRDHQFFPAARAVGHAESRQRVRESIRERVRRSPFGGHDTSRNSEGGDGGHLRTASEGLLLCYRIPNPPARLVIPGAEGHLAGRPLVATCVSYESIADFLTLRST